MEINGMEVELDLRYSEMNLSQGILQALNQKGFTMATPVQAGAIPCFKDWKDVIAKAPTGSGKTFAFGIPMVEHTDPEGTEVTGLILAPTRELALQIQDEIRQLCAFLPGIRVACLYGGQPIDRQINQLKKHPQIVVATRGGKGSLAYDGESFYPGQIVPCSVVDTMGAGDSFIAGFLMAWLKKESIPACMRAGAENAAVTLGYPGAW